MRACVRACGVGVALGAMILLRSRAYSPEVDLPLGGARCEQVESYVQREFHEPAMELRASVSPTLAPRHQGSPERNWFQSTQLDIVTS